MSSKDESILNLDYDIDNEVVELLREQGLVVNVGREDDISSTSSNNSTTTHSLVSSNINSTSVLSSQTNSSSTIDEETEQDINNATIAQEYQQNATTLQKLVDIKYQLEKDKYITRSVAAVVHAVTESVGYPLFNDTLILEEYTIDPSKTNLNITLEHINTVIGQTYVKYENTKDNIKKFIHDVIRSLKELRDQTSYNNNLSCLNKTEYETLENNPLYHFIVDTETYTTLPILSFTYNNVYNCIDKVKLKHQNNVLVRLDIALHTLVYDKDNHADLVMSYIHNTVNEVSYDRFKQISHGVNPKDVPIRSILKFMMMEHPIGFYQKPFISELHQLERKLSNYDEFYPGNDLQEFMDFSNEMLIVYRHIGDWLANTSELIDVLRLIIKEYN